ncbi:Hypothetical protein SMAX5B_015090 [Scophthalmus maximus]|uniref:Uncharacterized protein n=1 Tax=Scophthalmus maximus TaxID=52904 RepID=A0A2U9CJE7_SCOMX|nr:Hypothetical protein SMAX5B_015090 [Scophthalmus maximus]
MPFGRAAALEQETLVLLPTNTAGICCRPWKREVARSRRNPAAKQQKCGVSEVVQRLNFHDTAAPGTKEKRGLLRKSESPPVASRPTQHADARPPASPLLSSDQFDGDEEFIDIGDPKLESGHFPGLFWRLCENKSVFFACRLLGTGIRQEKASPGDSGQFFMDIVPSSCLETSPHSV